MGGRVDAIQGQRTDAVLPRKRASDESQGHIERSVKQLLPGIIDDITLDLIVPKLSWRTFYVLSSVSTGWKQAIRSGQVYDSRVRTKRTETLAVIDSIISSHRVGHEIYWLGLYSGKDKSVQRLPRIPHFRNGIPISSQLISLDGKIYSIGGFAVFSHTCIPIPLGHVYVLDVARGKPWERCKSMGQVRIRFELGVMGGKIYVFGGLTNVGGRAVTESEVYDPVYNTWHPFQCMTCWRSSQQVLTIGEEFFIYGGRFSPTLERDKVDFLPKAREYLTHTEVANFLEIYDPRKNSSRKLDINLDADGVMDDTFMRRLRPGPKFIHDGRLHLVTWTTIKVYDLDQRLWTHQHSCSSVVSSRALLANDLLVWEEARGKEDKSEMESKEAAGESEGGERKGGLAKTEIWRRPDMGYDLLVGKDLWDGPETIRYRAHVQSSCVISSRVSGNELVAAVSWNGLYHDGIAIISSTGFETQQDTIVWQKVARSYGVTREAKLYSLEL